MRFASFGSMKERRMVGFDLKIAGLADDGEQSAGEGILAEGMDVLKPFAAGQMNAESVRLNLIEGAYKIGLITAELMDRIVASREEAFATIYSARLEAGVNQAEAAAGAFARAYPEIADQNYESLVSDPNDTDEKALRGRVSAVIKTLAGGDRGAAGALLRDMAAIRAGWVADKATNDQAGAAGVDGEISRLEGDVQRDSDLANEFSSVTVGLTSRETSILNSLKGVYWETNVSDITHQANTFMSELFTLRRFLEDSAGFERESEEVKAVIKLIDQFYELLKDDNLTHEQFQAFLKSPLFKQVEGIITSCAELPPSRLGRLRFRGRGKVQGFADHAKKMEKAIEVLRKVHKPKGLQNEVDDVKLGKYAAGVEQDCKNMYDSMYHAVYDIYQKNQPVFGLMPRELTDDIRRFVSSLRGAFEQRFQDGNVKDPRYEELVRFYIENYQPLAERIRAFLIEQGNLLEERKSANTREKNRLVTQKDSLEGYHGSPLVGALDKARGATEEANLAEANKLVDSARQALEKFRTDEIGNVNTAGEGLMAGLEKMRGFRRSGRRILDFLALTDGLSLPQESQKLTRAYHDGVVTARFNLASFQADEGSSLLSDQRDYESTINTIGIPEIQQLSDMLLDEAFDMDELIEWMESHQDLMIVLNDRVAAEEELDGSAKRFLLLLSERILSFGLNEVANESSIDEKIDTLLDDFSEGTPCYLLLQNCRQALKARPTTEIDSEALAAQLKHMNMLKERINKTEQGVADGIAQRTASLDEEEKKLKTACDEAVAAAEKQIEALEAKFLEAEKVFETGVSQKEADIAKAVAVKDVKKASLDFAKSQPLEVVLLQQAGYKVEFKDGEIFMFGYPLSDLQDDEGRKAVLEDLKAMKKALQGARGDGFVAITKPADALAGVVDELVKNEALNGFRNATEDDDISLPIDTDSLAANIAQLESHITNGARPSYVDQGNLARGGVAPAEIDRRMAAYKRETREFGKRMALLNDLKQKLSEANKAADALYVEVGKLFGHFDLAENLGLSANLPKNLISLRAMYAGLSRKGNFRLSDVEALSALYGELKGYLSDKAATTKLIMGINGAKMQIETIGNPDSVHESVRGAMVRLLHPDMHPAEQARLAGESVKVDRALAALDPESQEWVDAMSADKLEAMTVPAFEKFYERMDLQKGGGTAKLKDVISNPARLVEPDSLRGLVKKSSIDYGIWAAIYLAFEEAAGGTLPLQCHIIREELEARVLKDPDSKPRKVKLSESKRVATAKDFVDALIDEQRVGAVTNFFHGYEDEVSEVRKRKIEIASIKQELAMMQTDAEDFNKRQFLDTLKAANDDLELTPEERAAVPGNRRANFFGYRMTRIQREAPKIAQAAGEVAVKETAKLAARAPIWVARKLLEKVGLGMPEFITNFVAADVKGNLETALARAHKHQDQSVEKAALEKRLAELEEKHGKDPDRIPVSKTDINMKKFFTEAAGVGADDEVVAPA